MKKNCVIFFLILFCTGITAAFFWVRAREHRYYGEKMSALEQNIALLRTHLAQLETGNTLPLQGDFALGISSNSLMKLETAFLPFVFPLKKEFSGEIVLESFHDIHFLDDNRLQFKVGISGNNIRYEGRKGILGALNNTMRDLLTVKSFKAVGECIGIISYNKGIPGLEIRIDCNKLSIDNVSPFFEELLLKQLNDQLHKKSQKIKINLKPQNIGIDDKQRTLNIVPSGIVNMNNKMYLYGNLAFENDRPAAVGIPEPEPGLPRLKANQD